MKAVVCLALLVSCVVAFSEEEGEIVYVKGRRQNRDPGTGNLRCNGVHADFRLFDAEIYSYAFVDPSQMEPGTYVEAVWMGPNKAGCSASRYPRIVNSAVPANSFTIIVDYKTCGFKTSSNSQIITYRNEASATLRLPSPPGQPGVIRRRTFKIPVACNGAANTDMTSTPVQYFEHIIGLPGAIGDFQVTFGALSRQYIRPIFGNQNDVSTYSLQLSLDPEYRDHYTILANKCWITPTADPADPVRYQFLEPQGCNKLGGEMVIAERRVNGELVYDVADVTFDVAEDAPAYYFHCEVNICQKGLENRCQPICRNSPRRLAARADDINQSDRLLSSAGETRRFKNAKIRINAQGQPYFT